MPESHRPTWTESDLAAKGGLLPIVVDGREILLVSSAGSVYAIDRRCPHDGTPLEQGEVGLRTLRCRRHGWTFDLETGTCFVGEKPVGCHRVVVAGGQITVQVETTS